MATERRKGPIIIYSLAALLAVLHQDFWFWDDPTLKLGFLPVGLLYHAVYSVAAAGLWLAAIKWAWPTEVEEFAEAGEDGEGDGASAEGHAQSAGADEAAGS
jgi:hypothetical protein